MRKGDRSDVTNKQMKDLLPKVLGQISAVHRDRPDLILAAWPRIIGDKLASMAKAVSFDQGILAVKVSNSTLYSLLSQHERGRLLKSLREQFPSVEIKNIHFRVG
jgi:Dna[CI] antecedent DciA-like protein